MGTGSGGVAEMGCSDRKPAFTAGRTNIRDVGQWCHHKSDPKSCNSVYVYPLVVNGVNGYEECAWDASRHECKPGSEITDGCGTPLSRTKAAPGQLTWGDEFDSCENNEPNRKHWTLEEVGPPAWSVRAPSVRAPLAAACPRLPAPRR